jgi:hypothetical protein
VTHVQDPLHRGGATQKRLLVFVFIFLQVIILKRTLQRQCWLQQEIILPPDEATNKVQSPGNIKNCPVGSKFLEFPCIPQKKDDWFLMYFLVPEKKKIFSSDTGYFINSGNFLLVLLYGHLYFFALTIS